VPCPKADLERLFDEGADVCRSLADLGGTLLQLDVDYADPREPGRPYRQPEVVLRRLEPVYQALSALFAAYRLRPFVVHTGRGYHFILRAPLGSPLQSALVELGEIGSSMAAKVQGHGIEPERALRLARGHEGAGRVLEHLVHRALHDLRGRTEVPVSLTDLAPPGEGPFVCLDLTAYADPLFERYTRCAFSSNQKAGTQGAAPDRPFVLTLPRGRRTLAELSKGRDDPGAAAARAARATATLPDVSDAPELLEDYRQGPVGRFHAEFYRGPTLAAAEWPFTYDRLTEAPMPACLRAPLEYPNPLLLRPACLRSIALGLWGMGWHPRSIAGIVASRFEQDHGWNPPFTRYDATSRAEFYVRTFCGAVVDGLDSAEEFTCESQRGRGLCAPAQCTEEERRLFASAAEALRPKGGLA
jgi:hypothetical protein